MLKWCEVRQASDILNIYCKKQVAVIAGFKKVISAELFMAADILPGSHWQTRIAAWSMVSRDARNGGPHLQGGLVGCCPSLPSSKSPQELTWEQQMSFLGRKTLTADFFRCTEYLADSVTSPIQFPNLLFSWAFLQYEICRAEIILKEKKSCAR